MSRVCCFLFFFHNSYISNLNFLFFIFVSPVCANGMLISAQRASTVAAPSVGVFIFYFFFNELCCLCVFAAASGIERPCMYFPFLFFFQEALYLEFHLFEKKKLF